MKNKYVELDIPLDGETVTIRFLLTKAQITVTPDEARALWRSLDTLMND